jgi:hypothetical protein
VCFINKVLQSFNDNKGKKKEGEEDAIFLTKMVLLYS